MKVMSVAMFVVMASLIKAVSEHVPPGEAVFFRSLFAFPPIFIWLAFRGELATGLRTSNPLGHLIRGVVGVTAMGLMFASLGLLPLPEVTAIGYATPLFVVIFAAVLLKERVRLFRLTAVGFGLIGVLIVLSPRLSGLSTIAADDTAALGALFVIGASVFAALAQVQVRRLVAFESTSSIVFWFSVTSTLLALLTFPFGWVVPDVREMAFLICAGLLGGIGQLCLTMAYRNGPAGLVAPFDYSSMLWALLIGFFIFGEVPTPTMLSGAALVIAAGVLIIWRERQLGLVRGRAKRNIPPV